MDQIKTGMDALTVANTTLKELREYICTTISHHDQAIRNHIGGLDADFQKVYLEYLESLQAFQSSVVEFETENSKAIQDRIARLSEYTSAAYRPRNIL